MRLFEWVLDAACNYVVEARFEIKKKKKEMSVDDSGSKSAVQASKNRNLGGAALCLKVLGLLTVGFLLHRCLGRPPAPTPPSIHVHYHNFGRGPRGLGGVPPLPPQPNSRRQEPPQNDEVLSQSSEMPANGRQQAANEENVRQESSAAGASALPQTTPAAQEGLEQQPTAPFFRALDLMLYLAPRLMPTSFLQSLGPTPSPSGPLASIDVDAPIRRQIHSDGLLSLSVQNVRFIISDSNFCLLMRMPSWSVPVATQMQFTTLLLYDGSRLGHVTAADLLTAYNEAEGDSLQRSNNDQDPNLFLENN